MKRKVKLITALLFFIAVGSGITARGTTQTKEYHESWPVTSVQALEIDNRFGEVRVAWEGGAEITIDVVITVQASSARVANELLELIDIRFGKTGTTVNAETFVSSNFKGRKQFSIDYTVNIPPDKKLNITNKYGDTFVNELRASGVFDTQYGNFNANSLHAPGEEAVQISLAYGKGGVENAGNLNVTIQYSTLTFGSVRDMKLNSKYAVIDIDRARSVIADSKYDTFTFGTVGVVEVNSKYTRIQMRELLERLSVEAGYGGVKVDRVNPQFSSISITSSYGHVTIGMGDAGYDLDASCDYCGIDYPESRFAGDRISETRSRVVKGRVGSRAGGKVYVRSRYGNIKLD